MGCVMVLGVGSVTDIVVVGSVSGGGQRPGLTHGVPANSRMPRIDVSIL